MLDEHPIFFALPFSDCPTRTIGASGSSPRSRVADTRANVPGGRVRRLLRRDARAIQTVTVRSKGGIQMAKKAAKGSKKKAMKKR